MKLRGARWSAVAAAVLFALLAWQVLLQGPLLQWDEQLSSWLAAHRQPALTRAMLLVSDMNETWKLLGVAALLAAWRWARRDRPGAMLLAVVPAGELLNLLLKQLFQRVRPLAVDPMAHLGTFSFPSGHAVAATVFYGAACMLVVQRARSRALRVLAAVTAVCMVALVGFSRVYLGAHYLSDVLAGACVGILCVSVMLALTPHHRSPPTTET
jgi:undecaprenyl-diphosphatase